MYLKKKNKNWNTKAVTAITLFSTAMGSGCGSSSSSDSGLSDVSLSSIPSASTMVKTNSSSAFLDRMGNGSFAVSGTAPVVTDLKANVDAYFFGGLIAEINAAGSLTQEQKSTYSNKFFGQTDGGPSGQGGCFMAQSVGEAFGRMLEAGTSQCYMKNAAKAGSGVTFKDGSTSGIESVFNPGDKDKLVKINVSNMQEGNSGEKASMDVFIKVYKKDTNYKVDLYFCANGSVNGYENVTVNKDNGTFTASSYHSDQGGKGLSTVTAALKKSGSDYVFDESKDRISESQFTGSWGKFKSYVKIDKDNYIESKMYGTGDYGTNKTYVKAQFGIKDGLSGIKGLQFLQAGFKGAWSNGNNTNTGSGAVEWRNTAYASSTSNSLKTNYADKADLSDAWYAVPSPSQDLSAYSCSATPDQEIVMDFSKSTVQAIQTICEKERFNDYDMCNSSSIQSAMSKLWQ